MLPGYLLRILLFIGLVILTFLEVRIATVAQTVYSSNISANKTIRKYQRDPGLLVMYGKQAILTGDQQEGKEWLQKALLANPLYIPAWLALAELENDSGNADRAAEILEYLDDLMQDVIRWRWEKAMLAYLLGRQDILKTDIAWLLQQEQTSRATRKKIINFSFSLWSDPEDLLRGMGQENILPLFHHAVLSQKVETASFLWDRIRPADLDQQQIVRYISLLINEKQIDTAAAAWKEYFPWPDGNLLYNGTFTPPLVRGGFGWRIWKIEEVEADSTGQAGETSAMHIRFNGAENISYYHVRQIIPLPPGRHFILSGELRSHALTTDQKPFIEVLGRDCELRSDTDMVQADQDWTRFTLPFTVPEECGQGVMVLVRRRPSRNIDNLISGDLWLTNFSLQETTAPPPVQDSLQ
ncbi:MAG: tetratricopeptide repeat protein [Candidatus Electrothrix sp. YB6]